MANATLNSYLNGYPDFVGNKKRVVVILNGPNPYAAGGVGIPEIAHVRNIHQIHATSNNVTYSVVPVLATGNKNAKYSDVKLLFFVVATSAQAGAVDLSATKIRLVVEGTN